MLEDLKSMPNFRYCVFQKEVGEEGTPHFQGFLQFTKKKRVSAIQRVFNKKAFFARANGSPEQNRTYCTKEDTRTAGPWEFGDYVKVGERTDIEKLFEDARNPDLTLEEIASNNPKTYIRYFKGVEHVRRLGALDPPEIREDLKITLHYGPPGTGKTRRAYNEDPGLYCIPIGKDIWYDGYTGQSTVLIDDFAGQMRLVDLLRLLDVYPIQVPVKGTFVWMKASHIIITSNVDPNDWYDYSSRPTQKAALERRFTQILNFDRYDLCSFKVWTAEKRKATYEDIQDFIEEQLAEQAPTEDISPQEEAKNTLLNIYDNDAWPSSDELDLTE